MWNDVKEHSQTTPRALAKLVGCRAAYIYSIIDSGELASIDVRLPGGGRQRRLIPANAWPAFLVRRSISGAPEPFAKRVMLPCMVGGLQKRIDAIRARQHRNTALAQSF